MRDAVRIVWRGISQFEHFGWQFIVANLFAAVLSLGGVTIPLAYAGLAHMAYAGFTEPTLHPDYFWAGLRKHWRNALLMGVANVLFVALLVSNFTYYAAQTGTLFIALRLMWIAAFCYWMCVQLYLWALLEEMDSASLLTALRNAVIMIQRHPGFSLTLTVILIVISAFSTAFVVLWALITPSIFANVGAAAVRDRLALFRAKR